MSNFRVYQTGAAHLAKSDRHLHIHPVPECEGAEKEYVTHAMSTRVMRQRGHKDHNLFKGVLWLAEKRRS